MKKMVNNMNYSIPETKVVMLPIANVLQAASFDDNPYDGGGGAPARVSFSPKAAIK